MDSQQRQYIAIDLKSFYASVECVERGLDPLDTCLVVADGKRTDKTICLAVSPPMKETGLKGRSRLFEVRQHIREVNLHRGRTGSSCSRAELESHPEIAMDFIIAPPRMSLYIEYSSRIYNIYLKYIAPEDIHVYSVDEVFMDVTSYLATYRCTAMDLARRMISDVLKQTGITATAGIGTNMYLCKVAMDIVAKRMSPDNNGLRIACLDEMSYRRELWSHTPLTDFWRIGRGIARRLEPYGIFTMGDIARHSLAHEELFYHLFGVNAELLIDHAWGWEPVRMEDIKAYRPDSHSLSNGQVLSMPYPVEKARVVALEMADTLALELLDKKSVTGKIALTVGYDTENMTRPGIRDRYRGRISTDYYGRTVPFHAHGTATLERHTCSRQIIYDAVSRLFDKIVNSLLLVRRITLCACDVRAESYIDTCAAPVQLNLFDDQSGQECGQRERVEQFARERRRQNAILSIKKKFGKNAILRGNNFCEGATQRERNQQIGGHKA